LFNFPDFNLKAATPKSMLYAILHHNGKENQIMQLSIPDNQLLECRLPVCPLAMKPFKKSCFLIELSLLL
jgi:hypothetical protein